MSASPSARVLRPLFVLSLIVALASASAAFASKPIKGATYSGTTVHGVAAITLKVAASGRSVLVSVPSAPLYCEGGGAPERQITKAAAISRRGSFKGKISYEFPLTKKQTATLFFSGRFSGRSVHGTVRSVFKLIRGCNGSTSFSARAS